MPSHELGDASRRVLGYILRAAAVPFEAVIATVDINGARPKVDATTAPTSLA